MESMVEAAENAGRAAYTERVRLLRSLARQRHAGNARAVPTDEERSIWAAANAAYDEAYARVMGTISNA